MMCSQWSVRPELHLVLFAAKAWSGPRQTQALQVQPSQLQPVLFLGKSQNGLNSRTTFVFVVTILAEKQAVMSLIVLQWLKALPPALR